MCGFIPAVVSRPASLPNLSLCGPATTACLAAILESTSCRMEGDKRRGGGRGRRGLEVMEGRCGGEGPPSHGITPHGHCMYLLYRCMNFCCHASMILLQARGGGESAAAAR